MPPPLRVAVLLVGLLLLLLLLLGLQEEEEGVVQALVEAPDGSVCFNNCNGHGSCANAECACFLGYHGDDCRHTFVEDETHIVPILNAGHFNLTKENFTEFVQQFKVKKKKKRKGKQQQQQQQAMGNSELALVGISSYACHKCIRAEPEYEKLAEALAREDIPFARADVDSMRNLLQKYTAPTAGGEAGDTEIPSLLVFSGSRYYMKRDYVAYTGVHTSDAVMEFIYKLKRPAIISLDRGGGVPAAKRFLNMDAPPMLDAVPVEADDSDDGDDERKEAARRMGKNDIVYASHDPMALLPDIGMKRTRVVGFFSEHEDMEEDEYHDFVEAAQEGKHKPDLYFAAVTDPAVSAEFKREGIIDRTPSVALYSEDTMEVRTTNLDDLDESLTAWIQKESVPLVGELTPSNFHMYEKLGYPMLILFLDMEIEPTDTTTSADGESDAENPQSETPPQRRSLAPAIVPGFSGGIPNDELIEEFREAAKDHRGRITFVYADGVAYADHMRALGLFGGRERLPALGFNTKDGRKVPFPEKLPLNRDTVLQFCADFLGGRLRNARDAEKAAQKALMSTTPINRKNTLKRKPRRAAPEEERGISEQFDGSQRDPTITIDGDTYADIVLDYTKDVVVLFHSQDCVDCAHFAVYYKAMARRFQQLDYPSLVVGRYDLTDQPTPPRLNVLVHKLPLLVMFPADDKNPPYAFYSGVGKVRPMMEWVQKNANIEFTLPAHPHLTDEEIVAFKKQVREREEWVDQQREEEEAAFQQELERRQQRAEVEAAMAKSESDNESEDAEEAAEIDLVKEVISDAAADDDTVAAVAASSTDTDSTAPTHTTNDDDEDDDDESVEL